MSKEKYKVISLFSGAMGLEIGLEHTGRFETVVAIENDDSCCRTLRLNRDAGLLSNRDLLILRQDISVLDPVKLIRDLNLQVGEVDLITGGPPCQAFSVIGRRRGFSDSRGQVILDFIRLIEAIRPRAFLMENVRGLLSMRSGESAAKGSMFRWLEESFNKIGYRSDCFVVNVANYGAPQIRERILVIGNRFNVQADFPLPTHSNRVADRLKPFLTLGDVIRGKPDPDPALMDFSDRKKRYLQMVPAGGNWRSMPVEIQKESMGKTFYLKGGRSAYWRKLSYEFPSPTIVTMPNHAGTSLCHPEELRPLTVGECSLVQQFPENWRFVGTPADKYKQVGNAVPVLLGQQAGHAISMLLDQIATFKVPPKGKLLANRVVHLRPHVRTRWWWKDGQVINGLSYSERPDHNRDQYSLSLSLFEHT